MIKAVIFDMDGIIIDSEPFWKEIEINIFNSIGVPLTNELCETTAGMRLDEVIKHWHIKYPWDKDKSPFEKINNDIVKGLIEIIRSRGELNKGIKELLEMFRKKDLPMAIASSSNKNIIDAVLDKFKIREYFKVIHSAQFEEYGKPNPAIYLTTAKLLGIMPGESLAIEDSFKGVVAAVAAGMKTAVIPDLYNFYNPKYYIADARFRKITELTEDEFKRLNEL